MGKAGTLSATRLGQPAPLALAAGDLALFVLNVGDGDALVVRFPADGTPPTPSYGVIDSFDGGKTIALIEALGPGPIRFVCATHPHYDHIKGLREVMRHFQGSVSEFWDSGFRYTSGTYRDLLTEVVEQASTVRLIRPTSGYEFFHAGAQLTVLSPSIALRNRYDTHGVDVNNASIVLRLMYPVRPPSADYPAASGQPVPTSVKSRTLILGGDAQTDAWGQVLGEFPHLDQDPKNWVRAIGAGTGSQPLACDLFKVSHHASKRGINLELIERLGDRSGGVGPSKGPPLLVASCATDAGSGYAFPHLVTQELLREVRDPQAQAGGQHPPDDALGIHYTSQVIDPGGAPAGSLAFVAHQDASTDLLRLCDAVTGPVDLGQARRIKGS